MVISNSVDPYTYSIGMLLNNAVYEIGAITGLYAAAIVYAIATAIAEAKTEQGNSDSFAETAINKVQIRIFEIMAVIMLVFSPALGVKLTMEEAIAIPGICTEDDENTGVITTHFDDFFGVNNKLSEESNHLVSIGGVVPKVPLLIGLVHNVVSGLTHSTIEAMPCSDDIQRTVLSFEKVGIESPPLSNFATSFIEQCYVPAYQHLDRNSNLDEVEPAQYSMSGALVLNTYQTLDTMKMRYDAGYLEDLHPSVTPQIPTVVVPDAQGKIVISCWQGHQDLWEKVYEETCQNEVLFGSCGEGLNRGAISFLNTQLDTVSGVGNRDTTPLAYMHQQILFDKALSSVVTPGMAPAGNSMSGTGFNENQIAQDEEIRDRAFTESLSRSVSLSGAVIYSIVQSLEAEVSRYIGPMLISFAQGLLFIVAPVMLFVTGFRVNGAVLILGFVAALEFMRVTYALTTWLNDVLLIKILEDVTRYASKDELGMQLIRLLSEQLHTIVPVAYLLIIGTAGIKLNRLMYAIKI